LYRSLAASKGRARRGDLRFGTTVFYARFHQYGTKTGLPARPVIDLSQRAQQQMTGALNEYVVEGKTS
jgi:phage gpG-like protein